jgi:hypothetical protein
MDGTIANYVYFTRDFQDGYKQAIQIFLTKTCMQVASIGTKHAEIILSYKDNETRCSFSSGSLEREKITKLSFFYNPS